MDKQTTSTIQVWDISVRIFHWALVLGMGFLWYSGEEGGNIMLWHMYIGYTLLGLVIYRLCWGLYGSYYASFSTFLASPKTIFHYLKALQSAQPAHYLSHNPLGGWMALLLMILVAIQATTGLFSSDDILTEGPLYSWVSSATASTLTGIHKLNFNLLLLCAGLHIGAVLIHRLKGENLVKPMLTGQKSAPNTTAHPVPYGRMVFTVLISAAPVIWLVTQT